METLEQAVRQKGALPEQWHLDNAPQELLQMVLASDAKLGEGSFSIVLRLDSARVLKITTCQASNIILPKLTEKPVPGLPLVYQDFGVVGRVAGVESFYEDIPLRAYVMERLYSRADIAALRKDACPRGDAMRARSVGDAKGAVAWLEKRICGNSLGLHDANEVPLVVQTLDSLLSATRFQPLVSTVRRLAPRVRAGEWEFDWATYSAFGRNVMLSLWGEPILSDPVYSREQVPWIKPYPWMWEDSWCSHPLTDPWRTYA
jgi:hypothetical protein